MDDSFINRKLLLLTEKPRLVLLMLAITCLFMYGKTIHYDYNLDDHLINNNIPGREEGIKGVLDIFSTRFNKSDYRPILILSYSVEKWIIGKQMPAISHAVNVVLYIALVFLIYYFIALIPLGERTKQIAFVIALLFATHPIHANVVGNLKSRDNILSMLFGILACIQSVRFLSETGHLRWLRIIFMMMLWFLSSMSKLDAVGFIFFITMIPLLFPGKIKWWSVFFWFIMVLSFNIRQYIVDNHIPMHISQAIVRVTENPSVTDQSLLNRIGVAALTGYYYIKMMIVPHGYWYYFGYDQVALFPVKHPITILAIIFQFILLYLSLRYRHKAPLLPFGLFSFYFFLAYCLNFLEPVAGIIADRYAFMASLGFCMIIAAVLFLISREKITRALIGAIAISTIYLSFSTNRAEVWKNAKTLIENDIPHLERSHEGQRIAAVTYLGIADTTSIAEEKRAYLGKALFHIRKANEIYGHNHVCLNYEGVIRQKMGDMEGAAASFKLSIQSNPAQYEGWELLGDLKYIEGNMTEALELYDTLTNRYPKNNSIVNKKSTILYEMGRTDLLIKYNDSLMEVSPYLYAPWENMGYFYLIQKDTQSAKDHFKIAVTKGLKIEELPISLK